MAVAAANKARLMLAPGAVGLYASGLTAPLMMAGGRGLGIIFPIQPDITYSQSVNYTPYDLAHTNYGYNSYRNTPSPLIQVAAQFASVTESEVAYTLATIHFLRSVTKMFFGLGDGALAGTPPPVLRFSAFGSQQFNDVRVVISNFATTYDSNVDLKDYGGQQVPVVQTIAIDMQIQQSPDRQKNSYSTTGFIGGGMYSQGFI
jgi:hypothetical protein